jgi:glucose/mannose transport system permease protein
MTDYTANKMVASVAGMRPHEPVVSVREGPAGKKPRRLFEPSRVFIYTVLVIAASFYLFPLYVMVITSFKDLDAIRFGSLFAPSSNPTVEPWIKAWDYACTGLYCEGIKVGFWNSVKITVPSVIVSITVASVTGYALAKWPYKGANFFFTILLVGSFIPYQVMLYPLVMITAFLNIFSTLWAVIMIHTIFGMPILVLLFRNYFVSVPPELFKAARVDGAGFWRIFFQVLMPMSMPIFVVAIILQVTGIWNDFLFGVIFAGTKNFPITVQLNNIVNSLQGVKEYNVDMAATILTGAVPLVIYFVSGKLFVRGIAAGAVKG